MATHNHYHPLNPYAFDLEQCRVMAANLLTERPPTGKDAVVCYRLESDDPAAGIARSIERQVFEGSFGNDADLMQAEYGQYESTSQFFLSVNRTNSEPIGALRVMKNATNSPTGFKTLDDMPEGLAEQFAGRYGVDDFSKLWDIATVAVLPDYRAQQGPISGQLYRAMYTTAICEGVEHFVSVIDVRVYKKMHDFLGIPFEPLFDLPPEEYLGTESQFVYGKANDFLKSVKKKRRQYIFVKPVREATAPLVGKMDESFQFPERLS